MYYFLRETCKEQIERMAGDHPETLKELRRSLEAGTASIVGGRYSRATVGCHGPESLLAELSRGQEVAQQYLGRKFEVFGQYEAAFSPLYLVTREFRPQTTRPTQFFFVCAKLGDILIRQAILICSLQHHWK